MASDKNHGENRALKMKGNVCLAAEKYESLSPGTDCRSELKGTERSSGYWREKNREGERARGETDNPEFWGWIERVNMAAWNEWLVVVGNCRDASETSSCIFDFIFNGKGKEGSITIERNKWTRFERSAVAKGDDESMLKRKILSYSLAVLKIIISGWCQFYSSIPTDSTFRSDIVINTHFKLNILDISTIFYPVDV